VDNLLSSISIAEREEGPGAITDVIRCEEGVPGRQYGTAGPRKKASCGPLEERRGNFHLKPGPGFARIFTNLWRLRQLTGILNGVVSLGDCSDHALLSVLMAGAWHRDEVESIRRPVYGTDANRWMRRWR
jgi:hypothetical protein